MEAGERLRGLKKDKPKLLGLFFRGDRKNKIVCSFLHLILKTFPAHRKGTTEVFTEVTITCEVYFVCVFLSN